MSAPPTAHPSVEVLRALVLGKPSVVPADIIAAHLAACPDCRKVVAGLSGVKEGHPTVSLPTPNPLGETRHSIPESQSFPPPDVPPALAGHPDYEVQRKLGAGGMGVVYLARNKIMDRLEVLKVINQSALGRAGALERFLQEIRSAARLHHPNVVTAYSASRLGDLLVLAMEFVDGVDLAKMVKEKGPLPIPHACHYARQVALGLQQAHEQGMVHRDVKPNNLILGRKSVVKILDFGLAKVRQEEGEDTGLTGTNVMMGTPDYMAPEQWSDARNVDIRADIYSLGCTLYYLLAGRPPFVVKNSAEAVAAHTLKQPRPVNEPRPEVPAGLAAVVTRMLAKDPAERYQTPAEVARALAPFIKGETKPPPLPEPDKTIPKPPPPSPDRTVVEPPPKRRPKPQPVSGRRVGMWAAVALAGLLLLLFFAVRFFFPTAQTSNSDTSKEADLARKQDNPQPPAPQRQPLPGKVVTLGPGVEMKLAWVPPGESWLGGGGGTPGTKRFTLQEGLWCGVYPVTQAEWQAVTGDNPSKFKNNPRYPVESVSWNRVRDFIKEINQRNRNEGLLYRLPTEEEWEYICRGGPLSQDQSKYHFYFARTKTDLTLVPSNDLSSEQANFNGEYPAGSAAKGKYLARPCDVGLYLPNPLGIYDLHGNVWEWTSSLYEAGGSAWVIRGGSWRSYGAFCAASIRFGYEPDYALNFVGFRLLAVPTR